MPTAPEGRPYPRKENASRSRRKGGSPLAEFGAGTVEVGGVVPGEQLPGVVFKINGFGITGVARLRTAGERDGFRVQNVASLHAPISIAYSKRKKVAPQLSGERKYNKITP